MKQTVLILSATQYRITHDSTGEIENEGTTVRYLMTADLSPHTDGRTKGRVPAKANLPHAFFDQISELPVMCDVEFDFSVDSKGRASLTPIKFGAAHRVKLVPDTASGSGEKS